MLTVLWTHIFREITNLRGLNILSQTHSNHVSLLLRVADIPQVGGEDLFGSELYRRADRLSGKR